MKRLISLGIPQDRARFALNRKGPWWNSGLPVLTQAVSPSFFQNLELYILTDNFRELRTTSN
jgi:hypothetical protein